MNSDGKDFESVSVRPEDKKSPIFSINTKAIDAMSFRLKEFYMETGMRRIGGKKMNLLLKLSCTGMFGKKFLNLGVKRQDRIHEIISWKNNRLLRALFQDLLKIRESISSSF